MLVRNLGVTNKDHYGMSWYFLEWSIEVPTSFFPFVVPVDYGKCVACSRRSESAVLDQRAGKN